MDIEQLSSLSGAPDALESLSRSRNRPLADQRYEGAFRMVYATQALPEDLGIEEVVVRARSLLKIASLDGRRAIFKLRLKRVLGAVRRLQAWIRNYIAQRELRVTKAITHWERVEATQRSRLQQKPNADRAELARTCVTPLEKRSVVCTLHAAARRSYRTRFAAWYASHSRFVAAYRDAHAALVQARKTHASSFAASPRSRTPPSKPRSPVANFAMGVDIDSTLWGEQEAAAGASFCDDLKELAYEVAVAKPYAESRRDSVASHSSAFSPTGPSREKASGLGGDRALGTRTRASSTQASVSGSAVVPPDLVKGFSGSVNLGGGSASSSRRGSQASVAGNAAKGVRVRASGAAAASLNRYQLLRLAGGATHVGLLSGAAEVPEIAACCDALCAAAQAVVGSVAARPTFVFNVPPTEQLRTVYSALPLVDEEAPCAIGLLSSSHPVVQKVISQESVVLNSTLDDANSAVVCTGGGCGSLSSEWVKAEVLVDFLLRRKELHPLINAVGRPAACGAVMDDESTDYRASLSSASSRRSSVASTSSRMSSFSERGRKGPVRGAASTPPALRERPPPFGAVTTPAGQPRNPPAVSSRSPSSVVGSFARRAPSIVASETDGAPYGTSGSEFMSFTSVSASSPRLKSTASPVPQTGLSGRSLNDVPAHIPARPKGRGLTTSGSNAGWSGGGSPFLASSSLPSSLPSSGGNRPTRSPTPPVTSLSSASVTPGGTRGGGGGVARAPSRAGGRKSPSPVSGGGPPSHSPTPPPRGETAGGGILLDASSGLLPGVSPKPRTPQSSRPRISTGSSVCDVRNSVPSLPSLRHGAG